MIYTNKYNLPKTICEALSKDSYDSPPDGVISFSASSLISPPRLSVLTRLNEKRIEADYSENLWVLLGKSVHQVLDNVDGEGIVKEERIIYDYTDKKVVPDYVSGHIHITGKPDIIEGTVIQDYKVTSVWSVVFDPKGKKEWHEQLNIYAYLAEKQGHEVEGLQIISILRDWSKTKAKQDPSYPQIPIVVINIPLWDREKVEDYIGNRLSLHIQSSNLDDYTLPECTPAEKWERPTKYAMMKFGRKTAIKVFDDKELAESAVKQGGETYHLEVRQGVCVRCDEYCPVNTFCKYWITKGEV